MKTTQKNRNNKYYFLEGEKLKLAFRSINNQQKQQQQQFFIHKTRQQTHNDDYDYYEHEISLSSPLLSWWIDQALRNRSKEKIVVFKFKERETKINNNC